MRARIVFGAFILFLVAAGATITAVDRDRLLAGGSDARTPSAGLTGGGSARPAGMEGGPGGDGPFAAFFATSRAIMAGDPGALFGHSSPSAALWTPLGGGGGGGSDLGFDAIAEALGGTAAPPTARHVSIDTQGSGGMGDTVSALVSQMSGLLSGGGIPTTTNDPAALEAMLDAVARPGAETEIPLSEDPVATVPPAGMAATTATPAKPVVVRRGGSSSEGLVQIGR